MPPPDHATVVILYGDVAGEGRSCGRNRAAPAPSLVGETAEFWCKDADRLDHLILPLPNMPL